MTYFVEDGIFNKKCRYNLLDQITTKKLLQADDSGKNTSD